MTIKGFCLLVFLFVSNGAFSALFNDQLTLAEFGTAVNNNISLQSSSRYTSDPAGQLLQTNDYQSLQLKFGDYATGRLPCRIGIFLVSESAHTVGRVPFGTSLALSSFYQAGDFGNDVSPNSFSSLVQNPNFINFSFVEDFDPSTITVDSEQSTTFLSYQVTYPEDGGLNGLMRSLHVQGSAYHDIEYDELTPVLTFGSGVVSAIEVDGTPQTIPTAGSFTTLKSGTKFKVTLRNRSGDPPFSQVWMIYVQSPIAETKIEFQMDYTLLPNNGVTNAVLTSQSGRFEGFLRVAAAQPKLPPKLPNRLRSKTKPDWQLATKIQSLPATPLSMFLLWPYHWTENVGPQLVRNQERNVFLSSCPTNSLLIPLLARTDLGAANCWYNQLIDKQNRGQNVFDEGTNAFVTLVHMLIASKYDSDILNYQNGLTTPVSSPNLSFTGNVSDMETHFDNYRSQIPTSMELEFNKDSSYSFNIPSLDLVSTFPVGKIDIPLFAFPGFKALKDNHAILGNCVNRDPIKGDVIYVHGNTTDSPGDRKITFKVDQLPKWAGRFLPDDFWLRINGMDKENLRIQLNKFLRKPLPGLKTGVYNQGKVLFQIAMSAKYATYVLLAQRDVFPPYPNNLSVSSRIKSKINPLLDYMKNILNAWLISQTFGSTSLTNFFVGDTSAKGVVAVQGTTSASGGLTDSGNAVYTGHNRQYGYFLGAAAIVAELDKLLGNTAWIGSLQSNGIVTAKTRLFVDMLWRDYANPDTNDFDDMPFNRYGNPWEGISCSKGVPPTGAFPSRNNESISEDFNGYYAVWLYARAIRNSTFAVFTNSEKEGFETLEAYGKSNLDMISKAARALFYNGGNWVYKNQPFNFNNTTGIEWDNKVDSATNLSLESPPCRLSQEGCIYSKYKFDLFCDDLTRIYNENTQCSQEGCDR